MDCEFHLISIFADFSHTKNLKLKFSFKQRSCKFHASRSFPEEVIVKKRSFEVFLSRQNSELKDYVKD